MAIPPQETITTVDKLAGKRIVTSFEVLAAEYFAPLDAQHGTKTSIEYVGGSVEAACNLGLADGIVDLVESGDTMRAAGLTDIATLMTSEATLIKSATPKVLRPPFLLRIEQVQLTPASAQNPSHTPIIEKIAARIKGVIAAREYVACEYNVLRSKLPLVCPFFPCHCHRVSFSRSTHVGELGDSRPSRADCKPARGDERRGMGRCERHGPQEGRRERYGSARRDWRRGYSDLQSR